MDAATRQLFQDYERASDKLDIERQVDFFADTFISAGPTGATAQSREQFMAMSHEAAEGYRSVGQTGAKILSMEESAISDHYSMVEIHWGVTFKKLGDKPVEFDVTYFLQKTGPEPKIIMFVAHQDEDQAMKDLGIAADR